LIQGADWIPASFSRDGKRLGYYHRIPPYGLWALPLDVADPEHPQPGSPESLFQSRFDVRGPKFSPDGRWISYRSNESGRAETYVRALRGSGGQWRISEDGGGSSSWSLQKNELFYLADKIYVTEYGVNGDSFVPGQSRVWADKVSLFNATDTGTLMPDGAHFVALLPSSASTVTGQNTHAVLLINFSDSLRHQLQSGVR
jgi:hypothetical protein